MRISLIVLVGTLSTYISAQAGVIYQTGFEPPTYTTGALAGQDGWVGSAVPSVQSAIVHSGEQAAVYDAAGLSGQNLIDHALNYESIGNPNSTVTVEACAWLSPTGEPSPWDIIALSGNDGFLTQLVVRPDGSRTCNRLPVSGCATSCVEGAPIREKKLIGIAGPGPDAGAAGSGTTGLKPTPSGQDWLPGRS